MVNLTPEIAAEVVRACQAGAGKMADCLADVLGGSFAVSPGEVAPYDIISNDPADFDGPGLTVLLRIGDSGIVAILPESTGFLPKWYGEPDAAGKAKLNTLAQELGEFLVPESFVVDEFGVARVLSVSQALRRGRVASDAILLPLILERDGEPGQMSLIWPIAEPAALLADENQDDQGVATESTSEVSSGTNQGATHEESNSADLQAESADRASAPTYLRNVLKIQVPVTVTLASQRKPVRDIVELGPGSIVKFEKTCDEPLDLCVGDRRIAVGEVVKVGDKFGLRIGAIVGPGDS